MATSKDQSPYQNNPFYAATDGLTLLFKKAQSVAILLIIISCIGLIGNVFPNGASYETDSLDQTTSPQQAADSFTRGLEQIPVEAWIIIGIIATIILLGFITIGVILSGITDYTAAQLAAGKQTTLGEAFRGVMKRFFGYFWLQILIGIKVLLWSLLLIIPGIIMSVRYSLSGTAFFAQNLSANAAIKHSTHLTKGAWLTTFSSQTLFNLITLGFIQPLLQPGIAAILFRQYSALDSQKLDKPSAHPLAWVTLLVPIAITLLIIALAVLLVVLLSK